jgi:hypothetical protein
LSSKKVFTVRIALTLIFLFAAHNCSTESVRPQSSDLVGRWKVEITFENQFERSFRFDAEESGKGSLLLEGPSSNWAEPAKPTTAKWAQGEEKRVTISGPVEFPIGNVGREPGTIVFKGTFQSDSVIKGEAAFFPMGQEPFDPKATPSKTGKFKASRVAAP